MFFKIFVLEKSSSFLFLVQTAQYGETKTDAQSDPPANAARRGREREERGGGNSNQVPASQTSLGNWEGLGQRTWFTYQGIYLISLSSAFVSALAQKRSWRGTEKSEEWRGTEGGVGSHVSISCLLCVPCVTRVSRLSHASIAYLT